MAKRFTDTAKWKKEFIKGLPAKYKLLWFYILDDCDHAGVWEVDFEVAQLRIGEELNYKDAFIALGQQLEVIGKNKWWIRDFISFQYGALTPKNKMYKPVMDVLTKYNIPHNIEHLSPIDGGKVKDKEKVEVEVKEKEKESEVQFVYEPAPKNLEQKQAITSEILNDERFMEGLQITHKGKDIPQAWEECWLHHSQPDIPPWDVGKWKQKLNGWLSNKKVSNGKGKGITAQGTLDRLNSYN